MRSVLCRPVRSVMFFRSFHGTNPPKQALDVGVDGGQPLQVGDQASSQKTITEEELQVFGVLSGDFNPIHYSGITMKDGSKISVVHGALLNSLVSGVLGTKLPGPGTVVISQNLRFPRPCFVGEEITTTVQINTVRKIVEVSFQCVVDVESNSPKIVLEGDARLVVPKFKGEKSSK